MRDRMENIKNKTMAQEALSSSFPVPFTLDEFRKDITEVFFHQVRTIGLMTKPQTAMSILNIDIKEDDYRDAVCNPDYDASESGVTYEHIRNTDFAVALERLYEYAFFGRWDLNAESMEDAGYYMWVSGIVCDTKYSDTTENWGAFGCAIDNYAKNCVLVAETANARNTLEGGERFHHFSKGSSRSEIATDDALTIRQMALLSGMEEMSIRSAANPKRANPLNTFTEDGGTRVKLDVAKAWLKAKGRYVPISYYRSESEIDLTKRKFSSYLEIWLALNAQSLKISDRDGYQYLSQKFASIGLTFEQTMNGARLDISEEKYDDEQLIRSLAEILELPAELLVLRCKELVTCQLLADVEKQLRNAINPPSNIDSL